MKLIKEFNEFNKYNKILAASDFIKLQIKDTEWENKVYVVGGAVRDELMGVEPKDLDLMVDKEDGGIIFAEWLTKKLGIYKSHINPIVYSKFGTAKFNLKHVKFNGYDLSDLDIESVMPRSEKYENRSRKPEVEFTSLKKDSERRDLTINSMFKNLSTGEILDLTGKGKKDLEEKIIKSPIDPDIIFKEDPLRMLRVIRTAIKYNWTLPIFMIRSIIKNADKISYVSFERIGDELSKMLLNDNPDKAIKLIQITKLSKYIFPELDKLIGLKQNKHHKDDAMSHTLEVLRNTPPDLITRLAALFHDIGKYKTMTNENGEIHFYEHEKIGYYIAKDILHRLKFLNSITNSVCDLIINHMKTKQFGDLGNMSNRSLRKLRNDMGENLNRLLDLIHADNISHTPESSMPNQIKNIRKKLFELEIKDNSAPIDPPLDGNDIMKILKIEKGPIVGKLLKELKELYLDDPSMTEEGAVNIIKKIYKNYYESDR